jgi:hypothetical protein
MAQDKRDIPASSAAVEKDPVPNLANERRPHHVYFLSGQQTFHGFSMSAFDLALMT